MGAGIAAVVGALIGLVGTGIAAYNNFKSQADTNQANKEINQSQLDYNASMTQSQWERDDNAHQREVADLKAAGLSPLASNNGAMNSSALSAPNPIAMQAPQVDVNALVQSAVGMSRNLEDYRHNKNVERQRDTEIDISASQLVQKAEELKIDNKRVEEQIRYQAKLNELESKRLAEIERSNKKGEELTLSAQESLELERESKRYAEEVQRQVGDTKLPTKTVYDIDTYMTYKKLRQVALDNFISEIGKTRSSHGGSQSSSGSFGIGINTPAFGVSPTASGSGSESNYEFSDLSKEQEIKWRKFNEAHPIPVYIDKSQYKYLFK